MNPLNVFHDLTGAGGRLGFFTLQTRDEIPDRPGCYGWFLPLWLPPDRNTLPDFVQTFGRALSHESRPPAELDAGFAWDSVKVRVRRAFEPSVPSFTTPLWDRLNADDDARTALQQVLLQASILAPPLYVGKTDNLRQRYNQHTRDDGSGFNTRFSAYAKGANLGLRVVDLIFVCIRTETHVEETLTRNTSTDKINSLLEEILKRLCGPPFSVQ